MLVLIGPCVEYQRTEVANYTGYFSTSKYIALVEHNERNWKSNANVSVDEIHLLIG